MSEIKLDVTEKTMNRIWIKLAASYNKLLFKLHFHTQSKQKIRFSDGINNWMPTVQ